MADEIRDALEQQGLPVGVFADRLGVSRSYIGDILNGQCRVSLAVLEGLALSLGIEFVVGSRRLTQEELRRKDG